MAWSAENATKAFLQTLKLGNSAMEPDVTEFISAQAAGNSAKFMVEACSNSAGATTLALIAAAHQTGGRVICIVPGLHELQSSEAFLGAEAERVELIIGDAITLLAGECKEADFVLVDCNMEGKERVFRAAQLVGGGVVVVGFNAFGIPWPNNDCGFQVHLFPIGGGVRVCREPPMLRKSQWVLRVDECTGEEHVFRITAGTPRRNRVEA